MAAHTRAGIHIHTHTQDLMCVYLWYAFYAKIDKNSFCEERKAPKKQIRSKDNRKEWNKYKVTSNSMEAYSMHMLRGKQEEEMARS